MEAKREGTPIAREPKEPSIKLSGVAGKRFKWLTEKKKAVEGARKLALP